VLWAQALVLPELSANEVSRMVSYVLTLIGVCGVVVQVWLIGPLVRRFGEKALVLAGNLTRLIFFGVIALFPVYAVVLGVAPFLAFGTGVLLPNMAALQTFNAPNRRGQVLGLNQSATALGGVLGPLACGLLFQHLHPNAPIWLAVGLTVAAIVFTLPLLRMKIEKPLVSKPQ
jgi:MFS transporter, DHA1 family, tetracycline resistance protein